MLVIISVGAFHRYFDPTVITSNIPHNVYKAYVVGNGIHHNMSALHQQLQQDAQQRGFSLFSMATAGYEHNTPKDCFITKIAHIITRDW